MKEWSEQNRYPDDEELMKFIEEMETHELYAPSHLKEETLLAEKEKVNEKKRIRDEKRKRQMLFYSIRVGGAVAAAIAVLVLIPQNEARDASEKMKNWNKGSQVIQEATSSFISKINYYSNKLISFEIKDNKEDDKNEN